MAIQHGKITGSIPLIGGQQWAITTSADDRYLTRIFEASQNLDPVILKQTIRYLSEYHDMLRVRVTATQHGWQQFISSQNDDQPFTSRSLIHVNELEKKTILANEIMGTYKEIDKFEGLFFHILHFGCGDKNPDLLVVIIHHLITDMYSLEILLRDFQSLYRQLSQGEKQIRLLPKTTSYKDFAERLTLYAQSESQTELHYWQSLPLDKMIPLPLDHSNDPSPYEIGSTSDTISALSPEETSMLFKKASSSHLQVFEVLLATCTLTIAQWAKLSLVGMQLVDFGRFTFMEMLGDIDLSRTVGYVAANAMMFLQVGDTLLPYDILLKNIIKEIQKIPYRGIGYEVLKNMSGVDINDFNPHLFLSYYGIQTPLSSGFTLLSPSVKYQVIDTTKSDSLIQPTGLTEEEIKKLPRKLRCNAWISKGRLEFNWQNHPEYWNFYQYKPETLNNIKSIFHNNLRIFISC